MASLASTLSFTTTSQNQNVSLSAIVKGAGPSGLASAVALAQNGFKVRVVEKRSERPLGQGRQNMVALRPEALRRLEELGALPYLLTARDEDGNSAKATRITSAETRDELSGDVLVWDLKRYPPAELEKFREPNDQQYDIPESIALQFPSTFVTLGDLEDSLRQAAEKLNVEVVHNATIALKYDKELNAYSVSLKKGNENVIDLGTPDLIVLASGKNDSTIPTELTLDRRVGVVLESANLPDIDSPTNPRALKLPDSADHELESQLFCVFGVKHPFATSHIGTMEHVVRKYKKTPAADTFQPVIEIHMNHAHTSSLLLHLPRSDPPFEARSAKLEEYVLSRINERLAPEVPFTSIQQLKDLDIITWGDPLHPVTVETSTAPQYAYGSNLILVGDVAMSCSPSSGIGAEIGVTTDSKNVGILAASLAKIKGDADKGSVDQHTLMRYLDEYNNSKAQSAVLWSQCSRMFYLEQKQTDEILHRLGQEETAK